MFSQDFKEFVELLNNHFAQRPRMNSAAEGPTEPATVGLICSDTASMERVFI
jgi:hypothetical protein